MSIKRHSLNFSSNRLQLHHSVYHPLRLGRRVEILDLLGEVKIFLISGGGAGGRGGEGGGEGVVLWGRERIYLIYFFKGDQFILLTFSHFEIQDFKNSKILVCGTLIFNIHISIFRFKIHVGLQVDIDFNTKSKISCWRSSFFWPLSGHSKPTKPMKLLSFLSIWSPNNSVSKVRAFCVNVNKHGSY